MSILLKSSKICLWPSTKKTSIEFWVQIDLASLNPDSESVRPIKVTLGSADCVKQLLSKAKTLKSLYGSCAVFSKVYLAPDGSQEEWAEHRKFVEEMKLLVTNEPSKHHMDNGKIISFLRGLTSSNYTD